MALGAGFVLGRRQGGTGKQKKISKYDKYGKHIQSYRSLKSAAAAHNIKSCTISSAIAGRRSRAAGYYWKYDTD